MMQIKLENLRFTCAHGWHAEEALSPGDFEVNVMVSFLAPEKIERLEDTLDYVEIYEVVRRRMEQPHKLLESLAIKIADDIALINKNIKRIEVNINKTNPPIVSFTGNVGVGYVKVLT